MLKETGHLLNMEEHRLFCTGGGRSKPRQSEGPACVTALEIFPSVILRWERMCSLRLMTCLSKRKSPPFSEAPQLPSFREKGRVWAKEGEREREWESERKVQSTWPGWAKCPKHTWAPGQFRQASKETRGLNWSSLRDPVGPPPVQTIRNSVHVCTIGSPTHVTTSHGSIQPGLVLFSWGRSHVHGAKQPLWTRILQINAKACLIPWATFPAEPRGEEEKRQATEGQVLEGTKDPSTEKNKHKIASNIVQIEFRRKVSWICYCKIRMWWF